MATPGRARAEAGTSKVGVPAGAERTGVRTAKGRGRAGAVIVVEEARTLGVSRWSGRCSSSVIVGRSSSERL
jgi:hypothetical protein